MVSDVTQLLKRLNKGDLGASELLLPLVYEELRQLAARKMARESPDHTLQPTALVHEAYVRLVGPGGDQQHWDSRGHFFAAACVGDATRAYRGSANASKASNVAAGWPVAS